MGPTWQRIRRSRFVYRSCTVFGNSTSNGRVCRATWGRGATRALKWGVKIAKRSITCNELLYINDHDRLTKWSHMELRIRRSRNGKKPVFQWRLIVILRQNHIVELSQPFDTVHGWQWVRPTTTSISSQSLSRSLSVLHKSPSLCHSLSPTHSTLLALSGNLWNRAKPIIFSRSHVLFLWEPENGETNSVLLPLAPFRLHICRWALDKLQAFSFSVWFRGKERTESNGFVWYQREAFAS